MGRGEKPVTGVRTVSHSNVVDGRIGLILAAGRGRRMGRTKQLVPWRAEGGAKPLVAAAFDAIRGVCDDMIVVLGHEADAVAGALAPRTYQRVLCDPDAPMFESIRAGLVAAHEIDPGTTIVMQPGDHPEVTAATLIALLAAADADSSRAITPEYQGRGGHPVLIPPAVIAGLLIAGCPDGLAAFWRDNPQLCHRVVVDDANVVRDVDTPEQLRDGGASV
jgi:molybdenum cofactor cytidylyltransferase